MDHIEKLLRRIPEKHREQVLEMLDCIANPVCRSTLRSEKLVGSALYRVRSGRYRIFFELYADMATVRDIRPRNEKTYRDI